MHSSRLFLLAVAVLALSACGRSPTAPTTTPVAQQKPTTAPATAPVITAFTADKTAVDPGGSTTLRWTIANATTASIDNGVGTVSAANGTLSVAPKADPTVYKLTATNDAGTVSATVSVSVAILPTITSFVTDTWSGYVRDRANLTWSIANATAATIDNGVGAVDPKSGNVLVSPTHDLPPTHVDPSKTYTLTATNAHGSVSATVKLSVVPDVEYRIFWRNYPESTASWFGDALWYGDPVSGVGVGSDSPGYSGQTELPIDARSWGVAPGQQLWAFAWVAGPDGPVANCLVFQILKRGQVYLQGDMCTQRSIRLTGTF